MSLESCEKKIERIRSSLFDFEHILNDPNYYIYEYFEEIKRQVDYRRESLKLDIDTYSDQLIQEINVFQRKCMEADHEIHKAARNIEIIKQELDKVLKLVDRDDIEGSSANIRIDSLNPLLMKVIDNYKSELVEHKILQFNYKPLTIERIFGTIDNIKMVSFIEMLMIRLFKN